MGTLRCALIILDGWGLAPPGPGNAIASAKTPHLDGYRQAGPSSALEASGLAVGLPQGQIGSSEVGHLNLGAGFRVLQDLPRIDLQIETGRFFENTALVAAVDRARQSGGTLHALGLFSHGGVHSHARHLYALLELAAQRGLRRVSIHPFLDGRDTAPQQALDDLPELEQKLAETGAGRIATVTGRYYAMDRDTRWERTELAYRALVCGEGNRAPSATAAVQASYAAGITDEFVLPTVISSGSAGAAEGSAHPRPTISDGDVVLWFNFRSDRSRQLAAALLLPDFTGFPRPSLARRGPTQNLFCVTFTRYEASLPADAIAFPAKPIDWPLARVVSDAGLKQCHLAETEKYAHVTYFFNGGREAPFPNESRILVPSPKVATYDLQPEMSGREVARAAVQRLQAGEDALLVLNFANGDMVGHTGVFAAAVRAVETVDQVVGEVASAALAAGGVVAITADHGNVEELLDPDTGEPKTAHTDNPVPFILAGAPPGTRLKAQGILADVAPTLLHLMNLPAPPTMDGYGLLG